MKNAYRIVSLALAGSMLLGTATPVYGEGFDTPETAEPPAEAALPAAEQAEVPETEQVELHTAEQVEVPAAEAAEADAAIEIAETTTADDGYGSGVEGFVTRLYDICLGRQPDEEGLQYWVNRLQSGEITGAEAASGFVFSQEFRNANPCNDCYVTRLYRAFMGREPDAEGKADWVGQLNSGASHGAVFNGFANSKEFADICAGYGIQPGSGDWGSNVFVIDGKCSYCGAENQTVVTFVTRLYTTCLDREPDAAGLQHWVSMLQNGSTGSDVAYGFVFSHEFISKYFSISIWHGLRPIFFVNSLYEAFFGREPDSAGAVYWYNQLFSDARGRGDAYFRPEGEVFNGFVGSQEFANLCAQYGISVGNRTYDWRVYTYAGTYPYGDPRWSTWQPGQNSPEIPGYDSTLSGTYYSPCYRAEDGLVYMYPSNPTPENYMDYGSSCGINEYIDEKKEFEKSISTYESNSSAAYYIDSNIWDTTSWNDGKSCWNVYNPEAGYWSTWDEYDEALVPTDADYSTFYSVTRVVCYYQYVYPDHPDVASKCLCGFYVPEGVTPPETTY